jgi:dihydrodipicolinate synthase/N-acetylneuraminate lyase
MKKLLLSGAYSPIPTPFDARGAVAHDKLAENIVKWSKTSLSGLLVLGSNGEFTYLNYEEKLEVLKTARQAIPKDKLFIAGTGCDSTKATLELTEQAAAIGRLGHRHHSQLLYIKNEWPGDAAALSRTGRTLALAHTPLQHAC